MICIFTVLSSVKGFFIHWHHWCLDPCKVSEFIKRTRLQCQVVFQVPNYLGGFQRDVAAPHCMDSLLDEYPQNDQAFMMDQSIYDFGSQAVETGYYNYQRQVGTALSF